MPAVALDEIQGNVLRPYGPGYKVARYARFAIRPGHGAEAAEVLAAWVRGVAFGNPPRDDAAPSRANVAFTYEGLRALGVPSHLLLAFPEEFREGARRRAEGLGDRWQTYDEYRDCHVLLSVHGRTPRACDARIQAVRAHNARRGEPLECVQIREAAALKPRPEGGQNPEWFGFADGRSQPAVAGVDTDPVGDGVEAVADPGGGPLARRVRLGLEDVALRRPRRRWRLLRTGEFVLGYENEDGRMPEGPPAPLGPDGTFMVYREMPQHVEIFEAYVKRWAERLGMREDELAAKIVGRRQDGAPLGALGSGDRGLVWDRARANHFGYSDDPDGLRCPIGAHVRRTNPRDGLPGGGERTMRHRIIRRGMTYEDDAGERGLVFVCLSSSIANGFEFIQRAWVNSGEGLGLDAGADFLLQQPDAHGAMTARMVIPGAVNAVLEPPPCPFVSVRGCEYLFVPSRRACHWLTRAADVMPPGPPARRGRAGP